MRDDLVGVRAQRARARSSIISRGDTPARSQNSTIISLWDVAALCLTSSLAIWHLALQRFAKAKACHGHNSLPLGIPSARAMAALSEAAPVRVVSEAAPARIAAGR